MAAEKPKKWAPVYMVARIYLKKMTADAERQGRNFPRIHPYFDSWDEAHQHLTTQAEERLRRAKKELRSAVLFADSVAAMKKPPGQS